MKVYEKRRSPLVGKQNKNDKVKVTSFIKSRKYKTNRKTISVENLIWVKDFGIHIKYRYPFPDEYNIHSIEKDIKVAHIVGQELLIKFEIIDDTVNLINIGTHKQVYGSTRKYK